MLDQPQYTTNPRYLVRPRQVSLMRMRLRRACTGETPLNAALFPGQSDPASTTRPIASTGPYASYVAGVTSPWFKVRPSLEGYVLIVSAAALNEVTGLAPMDFELVILSDHPVDVTCVSE